MENETNNHQENGFSEVDATEVQEEEVILEDNSNADLELQSGIFLLF